MTLNQHIDNYVIDQESHRDTYHNECYKSVYINILTYIPIESLPCDSEPTVSYYWSVNMTVVEHHFSHGAPSARTPASRVKNDIPM